MERLLERMESVQGWITFALVAILALDVSIQVFVRYVLRRPLFLWTAELAQFLLVWLVFLGIGVGVRRGTHFAMDLLPGLLGARAGAALRLFAEGCTGLILVLLTLAGVRFSELGVFQRSISLQIRMAWVFAAIPVGGLLALTYLSQRIQRHWRTLRRGAR